MKAALEEGRWTFPPPLGYLISHGSDAIPNLEPDPKTAPLVRKAFELYATGMYSKREVLRKITAMGLRSRKGEKVSPQTFDSLLRKKTYAGWLIVKRWGIERHGDFLPLIDEKTFRQVQALLDGKRPSLTPHLRNHPDFPLRSFVICGKCSRRLTASWSRGRTQRYPYYRCPAPGCKGAGIPKAQLEGEFVALLERLQPSPEYLKLFKEIVLDVWKGKQKEIQGAIATLKHRLEDLYQRKDRLDEAFVFERSINQKTYQRQLDKLNEEIMLTEVELHEVRIDEMDVEAVLGFAQHVLLNAGRLWMEFSLEQKQRLQQVLFPQGIRFSEGSFETPVTSLAFKYLQDNSSQKSNLVSPTGFEPVLRP